MPGFTLEARSMMTVSVIDDVTQIRSPAVRTAHRTISSAGASARLSFARLARNSRSADAPAVVEVIGQLRHQRIATGRHARNCGNASCRPAHEALDLPRHNRGSKKVRRAQPQNYLVLPITVAGHSRLPAHSRQQTSHQAPWPPHSGEGPARHSREARRRGLQPAHLPAEPRPGAVAAGQRTAEVDLESLHLAAIRAGHERALEADVGGLDAGT